MDFGFLRFNDLTVGMQVGVTGRFNTDQCTFATVTHKTAANVKLSDGSTWSKNLREYGYRDSFHTRSIVTEKEAKDRNESRREELEHKLLRRAIGGVRLADLPAATLWRIVLTVHGDLPPNHDYLSDADFKMAVALAKRRTS